jgi:murein DD-endopeptidase MepM/ murein hydrolase activator NlpD
VLDHGTGEFSMFDHLKQGSVPVRPGARVAAGAVVGACGNSGRVTHPALHYDLLTRPAEGRGTFSLPAQFLDYTANGTPVARGEPHRWQRIRHGSP